MTNEKPATKTGERRVGQRFIKIHENDDGTIEFRVFVSRPDGKRSMRVFGSGIFEQQDLCCLATTLGELARNSVCGAWAWTYETDESWEGADEDEDDDEDDDEDEDE
jgi:hypothetical protein